MTKDEAPTSPKDAALTLALEALENGMKFVWTDPEREAGFVAIDAINEALAQPERDPWREAAAQQRYFCPRCGKRLASGFVEISIHTCTPPREKNT